MVLAFQLSGGNDEKYFNAVLNVVLLFTTISYIVDLPDADQAALHAPGTCPGRTRCRSGWRASGSAAS